MKEIYGENEGVLIILHGGAGPQDPSHEGLKKAEKSLLRIGRQISKLLYNGTALTDVASICLQKLEMDPQFNAGIGSALQSDGIARLSASIMEGKHQRFSGVISASYIQHPSILAQKLQQRKARVLTHPGAELLARELGLPIHSNITEKRSKKWLKKLAEQDYSIHTVDTVGCVIRTDTGELIAAGSTGGTGFEYPGRVSDTATVAGSYASPYAAITATGIGEQIVDDAVAARIETRVRDGLSLHKACEKGFREATKKKRRYGWIAVEPGLQWGVIHTTSSMSFIVLNNGKPISSSLKVLST